MERGVNEPVKLKRGRTKLVNNNNKNTIFCSFYTPFLNYTGIKRPLFPVGRKMGRICAFLNAKMCKTARLRRALFNGVNIIFQIHLEKFERLLRLIGGHFVPRPVHRHKRKSGFFAKRRVERCDIARGLSIKDPRFPQTVHRESQVVNPSLGSNRPTNAVVIA